MIKEHVARLLDVAEMEDVGSGDHTSLACINESNTCKATLLYKESGIASGIDVAQEILNQVDTSFKVEKLVDDGSPIKSGQVAMKIEGNTQKLLTTERTLLNLIQRMSGVATTTKKYVDAIAHTNAKVLDTRKTTPGLRWFEKQSVKHGGGVNHRFGLYDMILIKDNHIDAAGAIDSAVSQAKQYCLQLGEPLQIEVEVRNFDELDEVLACEGVNRVMLDNFTPEDTRSAVKKISGRLEVESSGGITLDTIRAYAETGVDYISVGALTHSVKCLDISLKITE